MAKINDEFTELLNSAMAVESAQGVIDSDYDVLQKDAAEKHRLYLEAMEDYENACAQLAVYRYKHRYVRFMRKTGDGIMFVSDININGSLVTFTGNKCYMDDMDNPTTFAYVEKGTLVFNLKEFAENDYGIHRDVVVITRDEYSKFFSEINGMLLKKKIADMYKNGVEAFEK